MAPSMDPTNDMEYLRSEYDRMRKELMAAQGGIPSKEVRELQIQLGKVEAELRRANRIIDKLLEL